MDKVNEVLHDIKIILLWIGISVFVYSWMAVVDTFKNYIYETSDFDKYVEFHEIYIYNTRIENGVFYNDWVTKRTVHLRDSYSVDVTKELQCLREWKRTQVGTTLKEVRLMDRDWNPAVTSPNKRNNYDVSRGEECFFRYDFRLVNEWYAKYDTMNTNVFVIE